MTRIAHPITGADDRAARLRGIGLMLLSVFMFSLGDALGKSILASYSLGQLLGLRATAALLVLAPVTQFAAAGVISVAALGCANRSLKLAPASVVVPYQYTMILWAMLFGYWVFGDVPVKPMLAGVAIIIGAGFYIFLHERAPERPADPVAPLA